MRLQESVDGPKGPSTKINPEAASRVIAHGTGLAKSKAVSEEKEEGELPQTSNTPNKDHRKKPKNKKGTPNKKRESEGKKDNRRDSRGKCEWKYVPYVLGGNDSKSPRNSSTKRKSPDSSTPNTPKSAKKKQKPNTPNKK